MPEALRKTKYAELCAQSVLDLDDGTEIRFERIWVKSRQEELLRWTWWKGGRMVPRPVEMSEAQILECLEKGLDTGLLSSFFLRQLLHMVEKRADSLVSEI